MSGLIVCMPYRGPIVYGGYGLMAGGNGTDKNTWKYGFDDGTISNGTGLGISHGVFGCAFGNISYGVFCGGYVLGPVFKGCDQYTYSNGTIKTNIMMSSDRSSGIGVGNAVNGIAATGSWSGSGFLATVDKYYYTFSAFSGGSSLASSSYNGYGLNTAAYGLLVIAGGRNTIKYTYASDTRVAGGMVLSVRAQAVVIGTKEVGYGYFGNNTALAVSRSEYVFATEVDSAITTLATRRRQSVGASNGGLGIIAGGLLDSGVATDMVEVVEFVSDIVSIGTVLFAPQQAQMGTSTNPGHL